MFERIKTKAKIMRNKFRGQRLPPRGTGLVTGRARQLRTGRPRTNIERRIRHFRGV